MNELLHFFEKNWKIFLFIVLVVVTTYISNVLTKKFLKNKKARMLRNFANQAYVIGAAIANMERATLYSDDDGFKFFMRYAIRTCLGMPKSYPPDEPSIEAVEQMMEEKKIPDELREESMSLYTLDEIPDNWDELKAIVDKTQKLAQRLVSAVKSAKIEHPTNSDQHVISQATE